MRRNDGYSKVNLKPYILCLLFLKAFIVFPLISSELDEIRDSSSLFSGDFQHSLLKIGLKGAFGYSRDEDVVVQHVDSSFSLLPAVTFRNSFGKKIFFFQGDLLSGEVVSGADDFYPPSLVLVQTNRNSLSSFSLNGGYGYQWTSGFALGFVLGWRNGKTNVYESDISPPYEKEAEERRDNVSLKLDSRISGFSFGLGAEMDLVRDYYREQPGQPLVMVNRFVNTLLNARMRRDYSQGAWEIKGSFSVSRSALQFTRFNRTFDLALPTFQLAVFLDYLHSRKSILLYQSLQLEFQQKDSFSSSDNAWHLRNRIIGTVKFSPIFRISVWELGMIPELQMAYDLTERSFISGITSSFVIGYSLPQGRFRIAISQEMEFEKTSRGFLLHSPLLCGQYLLSF